jgi:putative ABC transport system permease protein
MSASSRAFRCLLHLYPAAFREEYGDEMAWAFAERMREESPWWAWPRTVIDMLGSALREHLDVSARDVRVAARSLRRTPMLTAVMWLALAVGIGANTAVYTIVRQVLWQPLPYADAERLVVVLQDGRSPLPPASVFDLRDQVPAFADVAAAELWGPTMTGAAHPERLAAMRVSPSMFALLGVPAVIGRTPTPTDTQTVVVSHRFWQERFGADRGAVGREVLLEGQRYTVIGVMPPDFVFSPFWARADVWGPLDLTRGRDDRRTSSLRVFARLRPGVSLDEANQQVAALSSRLRAAHPVEHRDLTLVTRALQERVTGDVQPLLWTLLLAVGCVLLVTCVNVASLLLARAVQRQPEMAVRAALGGRSSAITRQLLTESLVLATAGAGFGLVLALWLVSLAPALSRLGVPRLEAVSVNWHMAAVALALSLLTGILFGLAPAWTVRRSLRMAARGSSDSSRARQVRAAFVIAEVALAVLLVVTAGLLVRSFQRLASVDPGFTPDGLLSIDVSAHASPTWRENRGALFTQILERLRQLPGVTHAAVINHVPLAGDAWGTQPLVEGREADPRPRAIWRVSGPGYAETLGLRLRDGRDFTLLDGAGAPSVVMVNATFARRYLDGSAIGKRLSLADEGEPAEWRTVIGVVGDVRQQEWSAPADPEVYVPLAQTPAYLTDARPHFSSMAVVVRTAGDARRLTSAIRDAIWSVDADLSQSTPLVLTDEVDRQLWRPRFASLLISAFGLLAVLLAATGVYGLVAHDASRRTREIGIRLALGAPVRGVVGAVLGRGLRLVSAGIALGVVAAMAATGRLERVLFDVPTRDAGVLGVTVVMFVVIGLAASAVPAWRAARVDAARALRSE